MERLMEQKYFDEGELIASKNLISDISWKYKNFIDIVVYDALVCKPIWINNCIEPGIDAIVRVKKNKNNSIKQVKREVNKQDQNEIWTDEKGFLEC